MAANALTVKDTAGTTVTLSSTDVGGGVQAMNHRIVDATNAHAQPTGDAAARTIYVTPNDGTNSVVVAAGNAALDETSATGMRTNAILFGTDAAAGAGSQLVPVKVESTAAPNLRVGVYNGTNHLPAGDAAARTIFVTPNDGTNAVTVKAASTGAAATDTALVTRPLMPTNGTQAMPSGDAAARAIQVAPSDGTNAFKSGSAANIALETSVNSLLTTHPGTWAVTHAPVVATQATASKTAGGAGVRHICTGVSGTVAVDATGATAALITLNLRDGATGAGTILATWTLANLATAGSFVPFNFGPLNIPGTAATALTLETSAATGAHVAVSVTVTGYDCV